MTQLEVLIHRFLDDRSELSPDELDELIAGLRAEPARATALREQLVVEDLLAQRLTLDRRNFQAQVSQRIADFERTEDEIDHQVVELREIAASQIRQPAGRPALSLWIQGLLAVSLVGIMVALFVGQRFLPTASRPVATVLDVRGEVTVSNSERPIPLAAAATLLAGQRINTTSGGRLKIQYADTTVVEISGGTQVTLDAEPTSGAKRIQLDRGAVSVDVAPQHNGEMQLRTPHAVATVLGTQFRLTVSETTTLLEVTRGKVQLERLAGGEPIEVAAHEQGLASEDHIQRYTLDWPNNRDGVALLIDPFKRGVVTRNPSSGNFVETALEPRGQVAVNELTGALELSGGQFVSSEAGTDIWERSRQASELSLEIILKPASAAKSGPGRIVALESDGSAANFALSQEGDVLTFTLRTDAANPPPPLRIPFMASLQPTYITITYRDGELTAYLNGLEGAKSDALHGTLAAWQIGPLVLGGDHRGAETWQGTVEALALYHRRLDSAEVARNVRSYRVLSGRSP